MNGIDNRRKDISTADVRGPGEAEFPRRDWLLLPMLGLLMICLMVVSTEWVADRMFEMSTSTTLGCLIMNDSSTGVRAIPNTICLQKTYESDLVEYRFNSCGHRAGVECGPKPLGTYRIVMIGSSFNFGMSVPREQSFAALLPAELSQRTGRHVELYNEAMQWGFPASVALRFHQVFDENPDMILWVVTPMDVESASVVVPFAPSRKPVDTGRGMADDLDHVKAAFATKSITDAVIYVWNHAVVSVWNRKLDAFRGTPAGIMLQHVMYASPSLYVKSYLEGPEREFLKAELSPQWRSNLRQFDQTASKIEKQARAAGVPLVAVLVPNRAQAAMLSAGEWPAGYDPYKLDDELRAIIVSHGGTYVDILPTFHEIPNSEQHYFPVDGHPDAIGHAMISSMLARELTRGAAFSFWGTAEPQIASASGQGR